MIKFIFYIKMLRERNSAVFLIDRTGVTEIFQKTNYLVYYIWHENRKAKLGGKINPFGLDKSKPETKLWRYFCYAVVLVNERNSKKGEHTMNLFKISLKIQRVWCPKNCKKWTYCNWKILHCVMNQSNVMPGQGHFNIFVSFPIFWCQ
jgi:hypothetical protein